MIARHRLDQHEGLHLDGVLLLRQRRVHVGHRLRDLHPQHPQHRYVEMPVFAGCCDVAWEFVWSFFAVNNMGMLFQAANYVWFFLDAGFIFTYGVLFFGAKQFASPQLTRRAVFIPMCLAIARPPPRSRPGSCTARDSTTPSAAARPT